MDLKKYDEAIQACFVLIDFKAKKNQSEGVPPLEEKVIKALVGGAIKSYNDANDSQDITAIESARRSLGRVRDLLATLRSSMKEPWLFEISAYFSECIGRADLAIGDLMREYRSLLNFRGWETDLKMLQRVCRVISQMAELHVEENDPEQVKKFAFLVNGVVKRIKAAYFDPSKLPNDHLNQLQDVVDRIAMK